MPNSPNSVADLVAGRHTATTFEHAPRADFRLARLEVLNWGTFDRHVWTIVPGCENTSSFAMR